jgi:hypothetical protein
MPEQSGKSGEEGSQPVESSFLESVFGFFKAVLEGIVGDNFLRVLWGVEVLLFAILVLMIWFGGLSVDQRFDLALVVIGSVVVTFLISAWRVQGIPAAAPAAVSPAASAPVAMPASPDIVAQVRTCLALLTAIHDANLRVIQRGESGQGSWPSILTDTWNHVCETCHKRRIGPQPADGYFQTICAEPDVDTVCKKKWQLGEAIDDYRDRLGRISPPLSEHVELERLIRRSVTQPDWSPNELREILAEAIARAKALV